MRVATRPLPAALLLLALAASGCAHRVPSEPPGFEALIEAHLHGHYDDVITWCPAYLDDPNSQPRLADWCLYGLPAAMWLSLDQDAALDIMRVVCTDVSSGALRGDDRFRTYYAGEVVRWVALPLRVQGQTSALAVGPGVVIEYASEICGADPRLVALASDSTISKRSPAARAAGR